MRRELAIRIRVSAAYPDEHAEAAHIANETLPSVGLIIGCTQQWMHLSGIEGQPKQTSLIISRAGKTVM